MSKGPFEGMEVRNGWVVPAFDRICYPSVIDELQKIPEVLKYVPNRKSVIQAGGNIGIFARELSRDFEWVYTFEPDVVNYNCLLANTIDLSNVLAYDEGLGEEIGLGNVKKVDPSNIGAHYVDFEGGNVHITTIDHFARENLNVGLIWLDIEGAEYLALRGAEKTIEANKPVIVLEMAGHSERFYGIPESETEAWLKKRGYEVAARIMNDVIYVHKG